MNAKPKHKQAIKEIGRKIGDDLAKRAIELLGQLTEDEIQAFASDPTGAPYNYRLAKILLVAIAQEDWITWQWSAEAITKNVRQMRRIYRGRL